jgi:hypothetical protein
MTFQRWRRRMTSGLLETDLDRARTGIKEQLQLAD